MWISNLLSMFPAGSFGWFAISAVAILVSVIAAYLLGSLNFAIIFSGKLFHDDVRTHGSGNAGSTNMLRTYGKKAAAFTILCDMGKTALAMLVGFLLVPFPFGHILAGFFSILGHVFPVFFHFRGGKGVASIAMMILIMSPPTCLVLFLLFVLIVAVSRYVSLGSVMCMLMFPYTYYKMELWFMDLNISNGTFTPEQVASAAQTTGMGFIIAILCAALIIFKHKENIKRLIEHKESKLSFSKKKTEITSESEDQGEKQ